MFMLHTLARQAVSGDDSSLTGRAGELGQATAEYALVILGAAALAGLVLAWAASTGKITRLLNAVLDSVIGQVG